MGPKPAAPSRFILGMWSRSSNPDIVSFLKRSALGFRPNKRIRNSTVQVSFTFVEEAEKEASHSITARRVSVEAANLLAHQVQQLLEKPGKSKACKILKAVCVYRNMIWPKSAMGLQL